MLNADWRAAEFELTKPKRKTITLRISEELLDELKKQAKKLGLDYQRFIRLTLENSLRKKAS
jgi:predicted DNA binding CopG/RHH family protein